MTEHQQYLLKLLIEIDEICTKHDIEYCLAGGTLIGAIRHEGFLPWDDDADILMTRDNWLKFVEVTKDDLPPDRAVVSPETDRTYCNMFGRYVDTSNTAIHKNQILEDDLAGFVIDIFLLIPVPDNNELVNKMYDDLLLYGDLHNPYYNYSARINKNRFRYFAYNLLSKLIGKDKTLSMLEKKIFCYPIDCPKVLLQWGGCLLLSDTEWYLKSVKMPFEDTELMVPQGYADYLIWHYGDEWMYVPHISEQAGHDAVYNRELSSSEFRAKYMPLIDEKLLRKSFRIRKRVNLNNAKHIAQNLDSRTVLISKLVKAGLDNRLKNIDLMKLYSGKKYKEIESLFSDYIKWQLHTDCIGRDEYKYAYRYLNPVLVDVDDFIIYVTAIILMRTNRIAKSARLLEIRELHKGPLTKEQQTLYDNIKKYRHAISLFYRGEVEGAESIVDLLLDEYNDNPSFLKLKANILVSKDKIDESQLKSTIQKIKSLIPQDRDVLKFEGDLLLNQSNQNPDNKQKAIDLYKESLLNNDNGMIMLSARKTLKSMGVENE